MTGNDRPALGVIPLYAHDNLYVGIDIGKKEHVAAFVSRTLLQSHRRYEACPVLRFTNNRAGFRALLGRMGEYVPLEQANVLLEKTGHYHYALRDYLLECDITLHELAPMERRRELTKTDKRDAQRLANQLYNQLELHAQVADKKQEVRLALPQSPVARELHRLVAHRAELVRETTRRKNKLTSIIDQLFPEFTEIFKDPNGETALAIRATYPTAHAIATAPLSALCALRVHTLPSDVKLAQLQALAAQTIGLRDVASQRSLAFEQSVLIEELLMLQRNIERLEAQIDAVIANSREGRILTSVPGIGTQMAAVLIAAIGNVLNYPTDGHLKAYLGWSTQQIQTGTTLDRARLSPTGTRDTSAALPGRRQGYSARLPICRSVPAFGAQEVQLRRAQARLRGQEQGDRHRGRAYDQHDLYAPPDGRRTLGHRPGGHEAACAQIVHPEIHRAHVAGGYVPAKRRPRPARIVRLPKRTEDE